MSVLILRKFFSVGFLVVRGFVWLCTFLLGTFTRDFLCIYAEEKHASVFTPKFFTDF